MNPVAIISVSDKTNLLVVAERLRLTHTIVSTSGTARFLSEAGIPVVMVSDLTGFPEILNGRVKTLHPVIHGGILGSAQAIAALNAGEAEAEGVDIGGVEIPNITVVVCNLYPFIEKPSIENIDIGGVTLIRAAAKNYQKVRILTDPADYLKDEGDEVSNLELAGKAFRHILEYDLAISRWFSPGRELKYGCNPHQKAWVEDDDYLEILNGKPGYINYLDALNAWTLVWDMDRHTGLTCATSFKHVSPAGVGLAIPLDEQLRGVYLCPSGVRLTAVATAFLRARYTDPKSSFGDFLAFNRPVDLCTARLIKREVSDGVIAPGYSAEALEVLRTKKSGKYIILKVDTQKFNRRVLSGKEEREVYGLKLIQEYDTRIIELGEQVVGGEGVSKEVELDLILAMVTAKYTQSNSVVVASGGQTIGIGAGQQSRVDCVHLACQKARIWQKKLGCDLELLMGGKEGLKLREKVDLLTQYAEYADSYPSSLGDGKRFCLASDGFFPFRDNIDLAAENGVGYILQPGGSLADGKVVEACRELGVTMFCNGTRVFHH